uniref:Uncharacterized protein n=1 Tax=Rhizophora mucronata TaxID=61149 RepID=A0A2P2MET8_RHIMU
MYCICIFHTGMMISVGLITIAAMRVKLEEKLYLKCSMQ